MQISKYFTLEELTFSETATRLSINNKPSPAVLANLKESAQKLDAIRELIGKPVNVTSGYRSPTLNRAIGGSGTSHHCLGYAFDFTSRSYGDVTQVYEAIKKSGIKYDQLIWEFGSWVHISLHPNNRQQNLIARKVKGKTVYTVN